MSKRKLKSVKIVAETQSDDEEDNTKTKFDLKSDNRVKRRQKMNLFKVQPLQDEEEQDFDLASIKSTAMRKVTTKLHLFDNIEEDGSISVSSYLHPIDLKRHFEAQKEKNFHSTPSRNVNITKSPSVHSGGMPLKEEEIFISFSEDQEDIDMDREKWKESLEEPEFVSKTSNDDLLNDGKLPLSEYEIMMKRKLEEMEIRHDIYQSQIGIDGDDKSINDWESSKINSGDLGSVARSNLNKFRTPRLSLIDSSETFHENLEFIKANLHELMSQANQICEGISRENMKMVDLENQYNQAISRISGLV